MINCDDGRHSGLSCTILMFPDSFQEQRKGNWKYWCHHICAQSVIIFPVSKYSFVYIFHHSLLLQNLKKDEVNLLDWQASKSCVPAGRRCSLTLHWCQPGRQGLMRIFDNVVRIPNGYERLLQWLMLNWPAHKVNSCLLAIVNKAKND